MVCGKNTDVSIGVHIVIRKGAGVFIGCSVYQLFNHGFTDTACTTDDKIIFSIHKAFILVSIYRGYNAILKLLLLY